MVTKFKYYTENGIVKRSPEYSFTAIEHLSDRLTGIDNQSVISSIANTTLKGESERTMIEAEDNWFKIQSGIQDMDKERKALETKLQSGDNNGNPLNPEQQASIKGRIAELKEGTIVIEKEFYDHYTRKTHKVKEVHQTPYTIALENRKDTESVTTYLAGMRGVTTAPKRPVAALSSEKETLIRKELVRQQIDVQVGDVKDLIADMLNALSALMKQVAGGSLTAADTAALTQYTTRQTVISGILSSDYNK
jgi:hypothetical protein